MSERRITFVKKRRANGELCRKCVDVAARLDASGAAASIDQTLIADERDPDSAGMRLATSLGVTRAPFFVVEHNGETTVYTVYFKFVKDVLGGKGLR